MKIITQPSSMAWDQGGSRRTPRVANHGWEHRLEARKRHRIKHRERLVAEKKSYYQAHRDEILARKRAYYAKNRDEINARLRRKTLVRRIARLETELARLKALAAQS